MFAGKTTELIRRMQAAAGDGRPVLALKPARDTRYHNDFLATHTGVRFPARAVDSDLGDAIRAAAPGSVVGIDEAHFFGDALVEPVTDALARGVSLILAGVERDHRGRAFAPFPTLLCEADKVVKLSARCAVCGRPAIHSQRMIPGDEAIVVGGAEAYQARCRTCFRPGT